MIATYDTAGSAKLIAEQKMSDGAAIASARAAEVFGLVALHSSIQDYEHNVTRFLIVGRRRRGARRQDDDRLHPGERAGRAVQGVERVRAPRPRPDEARVAADPRPEVEHLFYADLAAARDDLKCARALAHLAEFAPMLRVLGSYPSFKAGAAETRTRGSPRA